MKNNEEKFRVNINKIIDINSIGCGYCKHQLIKPKIDNKNEISFLVESIPINIYQDLISKGWKRCGKRFFKSNYEKSCCKLYTPRVNINDFKISKEQKKVMKRFRKYLSGEYVPNNHNKIKINSNLNHNIINININNNKNILKEKIKPIDIVQNKIYNKLKAYIASTNLLLILNKYIQNINDINLIYEKISQAKVIINLIMIIHVILF